MIKNKYSSPVINIEELAKQDVLCDSANQDRDNQFVDSDNLLNYVFSGEWMD